MAHDAPRPDSGHELSLDILSQPDDATCGPTCLHAVYRYHGDVLPLAQVVEEIQTLESGGTLAVALGVHALRRGYAATIYTYNLTVFDPTWFREPGSDLSERLAEQARRKDDPRLQQATPLYRQFLGLGGRILYEDLSARLIRTWLRRNRPILTGLSATYLYGCAREVGIDALEPDDVAGVPTGHFVVLSGYDAERREIRVADPLQDDRRSGSRSYWVGLDRAIGAILLGVLTYDANLLVLEPQRPAGGSR
jgi:hypothetical protein